MKQDRLVSDIYNPGRIRVKFDLLRDGYMRPLPQVICDLLRNFGFDGCSTVTATPLPPTQEEIPFSSEAPLTRYNNILFSSRRPGLLIADQ
ncbi:hypothetical protein PanWU01x14_028080 [Parasponia andersonii]|uniref:Uncharacterized protein n=1 Tax=Parasponia andersonii TaxID=3476 RepID=A0A2P5DVA4_PARAD|nr:hypothetical protein PanWU01x14_028080 [Parasponia andersonii]